MPSEVEERIAQKVEEIRGAFGKDIVTALKQANAAHLTGKGKVTATPVVDHASLVNLAYGDSGHTGFVADAGDIMTGDLRGTDFVSTRSGTITRVGGYVSSVAKTGGRTITITRDGSNYISSVADGTNTWTFTRDGSNIITSWSVT